MSCDIENTQRHLFSHDYTNVHRVCVLNTVSSLFTHTHTCNLSTPTHAHCQERLNKCLMNGCNKSFNTTEALQRHLQRHFDRTPTPPPPKPIAVLKVNKLSKKNSSQTTLSDDLTSSLSQSADEDFFSEDVLADEEESDDSYVPGSQSESQMTGRGLEEVG